MPRTPVTLNKETSSYAVLRDKIKATMLFGRRKIEAAKVETYLSTGQLIDGHVLGRSTRDEHYGKVVIERLADDLGVSSSVLWRCLRFARSFKKILARGPESFPGLAWSHYRKLITIPDEDTRLAFMQRAEKGGWSAEELGGKIHLEMGSRGVDQSKGSLQDPKKDLPPAARLIPKKGEIYTYRLIAPDSLHENDDRLWIDLGFQAHRKIPFGAKGFKAGGIVESIAGQADQFSIVSSKRGDSELFTYKGFVERVVDGDTLIVKIDLGFETRIRQYLRLRGIDAPEIATPEGKKAKAFVEAELSQAPHIILTSSRSDKYDRYLADVFYERKPGEELYLNQALLDQGLAKRMM